MAYFDTGGKIREIREQRNLTQDQLAELSSLNRVTIAKYESGRVEPGAKAISRIADALDVSADLLLGRSDEPAEPQQEEHPKTPQIRIVSGWMENMPKEDQDRVVQMIELMFAKHPELLHREDDNNNDQHS